MFKKFINDPFATIGNAVEINVYKVERKNLENEKKEYENKLKRYNQQVEFQADLSLLTLSNDTTIKKLQTIFTVNDVKYDVPYDEFKLSSDEEYDSYKKLYDHLVLCNTQITNCNIKINKNVGIDKQIYVDKINELDEKLNKVNQKLRSTRDKQFGKKET